MREITLQTVKIIWGALFLNQFIFVAAAYYVLFMMSGRPTHQVEQGLQLGISGVSLTTLLLSWFLPRLVMKKRQNAQLEPIQSLLPRIWPAYVIRLALLEALIIMGFGLTFLSGDFTHIVILAILSVMGFLLNFPSEKRLREFGS